jgi:alkanesulfonate monooxygenase SsuD/methylene tetrahydromethanopterin reductase-like flavin-dependent oxidoreductase (luciferase family)
MKFILQAGNWYDRWNSIEKAVPTADKSGFWGFVVPDHYMWGNDRGGDSTLESWVALTYLAAKTENLHLGTLVTPIPFRPPGMLAKEVATLDLISQGRAMLGVGAGWSETEFQGYSEWNDPKVRVDKTVEGLKVILDLWTSKEKVNHSGKYYKLSGAVLEPKPVQKPYPPLLFGGVSNRMLRLAGHYADICLIPPWVTSGLDAAKKVVMESARKYDRLNKISFAALSFSREGYDRAAAQKQISEAKDRGCEYYIMGFPLNTYEESMKDFAKNIIPSF